jgi:hypothetical protein
MVGMRGMREARLCREAQRRGDRALVGLWAVLAPVRTDSRDIVALVVLALMRNLK